MFSLNHFTVGGSFNFELREIEIKRKSRLARERLERQI